jgi:saccharopine dehydrogenase-like NADP-dependent oxidoreductase
MRVLVIGSGGVGAAVAAVARRRGFFERMTFADVSLAPASRTTASPPCTSMPPTRPGSPS